MTEQLAAALVGQIKQRLPAAEVDVAMPDAADKPIYVRVIANTLTLSGDQLADLGQVISASGIHIESRNNRVKLLIY